MLTTSDKILALCSATTELYPAAVVFATEPPLPPPNDKETMKHLEMGEWIRKAVLAITFQTIVVLPLASLFVLDKQT